MDVKEISAFLAPPKMTARETLLSLTGGGIGLLLVAAGASFYKHDYRDGILCFLVATLFGFVFFRKRKVALVVSGFSCILALGGLGFPFHLSFPSLALLLGLPAELYLTIRCQIKKYPYIPFN